MPMVPDWYDWRTPDITRVFSERAERLIRIRAEPSCVPALKRFYRDNPAQFICDWGCTDDPRNVEVGLPPLMPLLLFPKQVAWVEFILDRWRNRQRGLTEKAREVGITWTAVALSCTLCLFYEGMAIGFGSRKEEYVDKLGDPKAILPKARSFMRLLPREFRGGWDISKHAPFMRMVFPESNSIIAGESGDEIGRGDRKSIYFVDEAAHLERPMLAEASLSNTTNCRQDMSSVNTMANPFAEKRHGGKIPVFTFGWRDDPRKDDAWYQKKCDELDPVTVAQEIDLNYSAAQEGVIIPSVWVSAAVDAHNKLGIKPSGVKMGSLDIADEGIDKNGFAACHGIHITHCESWSGKGSDPYASVERAFMLCDTHNLESFIYDADGMGASVRGDARKINELRHKNKKRVIPYRGSDAVLDPDRKVSGTERTALDFFQNRKAQSWWNLRSRFLATYRAVNGKPYDAQEVIGLDRDMPELSRLLVELSQPVWKPSQTGKMMVEKKPEDTMSPNLADAVCMLMSPYRKPMVISEAALEAVSGQR